MRQLSLILLLACAACTSSGTTGISATAPANDDLPAQMRALIGSAACTDSSQCKTVPLGARACGGPEGYLAYSATATPSAPLQALAERHAQQQRTAQAKSGMASTCQFIPDPGAQCRAGACVVGNSVPGAS
ncbi:MAG: hypothetical protein V4693_08995 [Pseudomonadota bacterium]